MSSKSLSLSKLDKLLEINNLVVDKFLIRKGKCVFISALSTSGGVLISIPSRYKFNTPNDPTRLFNIKKIDIKDEEKIMDRISNYMGNDEYFNDKQSATSNHIAPKEEVSGNLESYLEGTYKTLIKIKDVDSEFIKRSARQLSRLNQCLNGSKYCISILHDRFLMVAESDKSRKKESVKVFILNWMESGVNNEHSLREHKIYITMSLDFLYEKLDVIHVNLRSIHVGMKKLMARKRVDNLEMISSFMKKESDMILTKLNDSYLQKTKSISLDIDKLRADLKAVNVSKDRLKKEASELIDSESKENTYKSVYERADIVKRTERIEKKLRDNAMQVKKINRGLNNLRETREMLALEMDNILFDNTVMLHTVFENFKNMQTKINSEIL